jgi:transcription initiation factor TFIID TATA-box-binding protein
MSSSNPFLEPHSEFIHSLSTNGIPNKIRLINITATFHVGRSINIFKLVTDYSHILTYSSTFPAAMIQLQSPKCTCLIFLSGKVVITGSNIMANARHAANMCCVMLNKCNVPATVNRFVIDNILFSTYTGFTIQSIYMYEANRDTMMRSNFPGTSISKPGSSHTVIAFTSGKVNITGVKTEDEVEQIYRDILPTLTQFRSTWKKSSD